ncbi:efflux RND transporter periplasmic adaptor subunit [Membranihabitans marinus]|uniref:efflux RND transporter periplasmic adaptor subunit n=1 Tax=Membranihabitans marinus TaxID=1227546 RepID=UPI001EFFF6BB|nr:efflux RND transporter periplasmic adaptor subunit [Membranihabitans marinus]
MKYAYLILILSLLYSCGSTTSEVSEINVNDMALSELKSYLKTKKDEVKNLQSTIANIEDRMAELDPTSVQKVAKRVTTLPIVKSEFKHFISVQGLLEANDVIAINAETGGRMLQLKIDEGDYVKKGDLVAVLDTENFDKQRDEILKALELAKEVYERRKRLWDQKIGSEIEYLQSKNDVERMEKSLETLDFQQTKGQVYAPVSGVVDVINIHPGEMVSPGMPIANILDVSRLIATADVPENYLGSVKVGDRVLLNFPSIDYSVEGRINLIGNTIDAANRTFKIEVRVARTTKNLKPNLLTEIKINDKTIADVISIPVNSVLQEVSGKEYVMVVNQSGSTAVAEKKYVTRGPFNNEEVVITSGLEEGQVLVNIGAQNLVDKDALEVISTKELDEAKKIINE